MRFIRNICSCMMNIVTWDNHNVGEMQKCYWNDSSLLQGSISFSCQPEALRFTPASPLKKSVNIFLSTLLSVSKQAHKSMKMELWITYFAFIILPTNITGENFVAHCLCGVVVIESSDLLLQKMIIAFCV